MSLWRYPRTAAALCIAAVLACAAAPAAFLAASDAAYFGRVETVADPYRAPTPTADDYYILRQLAARGQDTTARQTTPQQEQDAAPQTPKVYIGASASIESMTWRTLPPPPPPRTHFGSWRKAAQCPGSGWNRPWATPSITAATPMPTANITT